MEDTAIGKKVKLRNNITGTEADDLLIDLEDEFKEKVMNYCHIDAIPASLTNVIASMVSDRYKEIQAGLGKSEGIVSSLSDGQQSVSYKQSIEVYKKSDVNNDILSGYENQLNAYRKMAK